MARYALVDCKPVPAKLEEEILELKRRTGATLNSCLRNQAAVKYARSQGCELSSQEELYDCFRRGMPGCNPANPPGLSTHEQRSDGQAYAVPRGSPLAYWQVGMDWSDPGAIVAEARDLGFVATVTYPNNPREAHHVNFRKEPTFVVFQALRRGDKGARVTRLTTKLAYLRSPHTWELYLTQRLRTFGDRVEAAVRKFQADHLLGVDGEVGAQTWAQMKVAVRRQKADPLSPLTEGERQRVEELLRLRDRAQKAGTWPEADRARAQEIENWIRSEAMAGLRKAIDEGGEHEAWRRERYEILRSVHGAWREEEG